MKNIIWIAVLAGAALAIFSWWGKRNEVKAPVKASPSAGALPAATQQRLADCSTLPKNEQAKCMGFTANGIPVAPKINLSVV